MSRDLSSGALAEVTADSCAPVLFYEGEFSGGTVRLWTGVGSVSWNAQTWTGAGSLLAVSGITETVDLRAVGITVSLSGMPSSLISIALAQANQGLPGRVYLGFLTDAGAIVADPYLSFSGRLDVPEISDDGETCTISISYESRLIDLERPRARRYTAADQKARHPTDLGFDNVPGLQDAVIIWGPR